MTARRMDYRAGPVTVRAAVPDGVLHEAARVVFPDYQVEEVDGPEVDLGVAGTGDGRFQLSVRGETGGPVPPAEVFVRFELALAEMLLAGSGAVALHGGAVLGGNGAVLFSGPSSSGKSTLSLGLAAGGRPVFGDDVVLLDPEAGTIRPFKRLMKLVDPAPRLLGLQAWPSVLRMLCPDAVFFHPSDIGSLWAPASRIASVVFPTRHDGVVAPRLTPLSGGETTRRLLDQTLLIERLGPLEFETISRALEAARFFELAFSESREAITLLQEHPGLL